MADNAENPAKGPLPCTRTGRPRRMGLLRRFGRHQRGATAVEFGLIAVPFMFLLMMIVETSLVFWTRQVVQEATSQAARTVLTGESRTMFTGTPAAQTSAFRDAICQNMRMSNIADCQQRLFIDVQTSTNFPPTVASMIQGGNIDPTSFSMRQPGPNQITIVRAVYTLPVITAGFFSTMSRLNSGQNAVEVTIAFRTEPFPP